MNNNVVKVIGRAEIPEDLVLGNEYDLTIANVECRKTEEVPNDDGTNTKIYYLKISAMSEINIVGEREIIKSVQG